MQVSSGAAFGVRGRLLGSGITWFIAIGFAIILVFTSGEAIIYTFNRWFQTSTSNTALSIAMIAVLILACVSAVLGHRTLERSVRVITILAIIVGIAIFAVFAPKFHVTHGANYLLGSFWPTWFLERHDRRLAADLLGPVRRRLRPLHPCQRLVEEGDRSPVSPASSSGAGWP